MGEIILDTNIVIRMKGQYINFTNCFESTCDVIILSPSILKEYESVSKTSILIIHSFLDDLKKRNKLKFINKSRIDAIYRRNTRMTPPSLPSDRQDHKFVRAAIASESKFIISRDTHLKEISPIRWNGKECDVIEPQEYINDNCPEMRTWR